MSFIRFMIGNHVAANILMLLLMVGGFMVGMNVKLETFPEIPPGVVRVMVPYPGASPEEVEQGVCLAVEEAISGVDGIENVISTAMQGAGGIVAQLYDGVDAEIVANDIRIQVDSINNFPLGIETPTVTAVKSREHVISLVIYGDMSERALAETTERVRDELLSLPGITQLDFSGLRPYEISVEVPEENLRRYGLTLGDVADVVRRSSLDLPGGSVKTAGGEVLIRTKEKAYIGEEYARIPLKSMNDGSTLYLGDIADIRDGFQDVDDIGYFDGRRAAMLQVYRVGDQTPLSVSATINKYVADKSPTLPPGLHMATWNDQSEMLRSRIDLLTRNARTGLLLVIICLSLFLEIKLAFWVTLGIPISFLGAMLMFPGIDASINMISLFGFILCLGIVVDDAIVVGESIYKQRQLGKSGWDAAFSGVWEVAGPVTFGVLTTVAAFMPLLFISGTMGHFLNQIPKVVIPVLLFSLVESLFILPSHLNRKAKGEQSRSFLAWVDRVQGFFDAGLRRFVEGVVQPMVRFAVAQRYSTLALALTLLMLTVGALQGGIVRVTFFPQIDADEVNVTLTLPFGTPVAVTDAVRRDMMDKLNALIAEYDKDMPEGVSNVRHVFSTIGSSTANFNPHNSGGRPSAGGSHICAIAVLLQGADVRNCSSGELASRWRESVGEVPGAESLSFNANLMRASVPIDIEVGHGDPAVLDAVGERIKTALAGYPGLKEIQDNRASGKAEWQLKLKPEARAYGITQQELGRQVQGAFYGAEALRLQRGRNEVKVMVRYPEEERRRLHSIESMRIRTPDGGEIPFSQAAEVIIGSSEGEILRKDKRRVMNVTANADPKDVETDKVMAELAVSLFPRLQADYPGLSFNMEGEQKERRDSTRSMLNGFVLAQIAIFGLLAISLGSYVQPVIVMSAIPFGLFGAVMGHLIMGYDISLLSFFGLVALTGVVVNDSLILIDRINSNRREGMKAFEAVVEGVQRRFRPILLTSMTTFCGVTPIILETSVQASFLIPMAISLGFGVMFSTFTTLLLVPSLYMILEDVYRLFGSRMVVKASPEDAELTGASGLVESMQPQ